MVLGDLVRGGEGVFSPSTNCFNTVLLYDSIYDVSQDNTRRMIGLGFTNTSFPFKPYDIAKCGTILKDRTCNVV
jgi:hypothetical protein